MGPFDAIWHLLNFFAPALGVSLIATALSKLLWRRELAAASWWRLTVWGAAAGAVALIGGLIVLGRDGRMVTYGALVLAVSLGLWWAGFARR